LYSSILQQQWPGSKLRYKKFQLPVNTSIRAIAAVNDSICWFGGSNNCYGYTTNAGKTWFLDSLNTGTKSDFRSIAVLSDSIVLLINTGSPARIYRSSNYGKNFNVVYENLHADVFFDAMAFKNNVEGYAVSDPINQCVLILHSIDTGKTWQTIPCNQITPPYNGEAFFASSNSNIVFTHNTVHILSGGSRSRIYNNNQSSFIAYDTPILRGAQMHGIYSACAQKENVFIAGGDYNDKSYNYCNKALSTNSGKSFNLVANGKPPGMVSCVQYLPKKKKHLLAAGFPGIYYSKNNGRSWKLLDEKSMYYTLRFSPQSNVFYIAGPKGSIARGVFKQ
jgi:photosystem II stability/assembly factor-like uncharacterized protein